MIAHGTPIYVALGRVDMRLGAERLGQQPEDSVVNMGATQRVLTIARDAAG